MTNIHPIMVHFTIALFVAAVALDILGRLLDKDSLRSAGWWNLCAAALASVATVASGVLAESSLPHNDAIHEIMTLHERIGFAVMGIILVLFLGRLLLSKKALAWFPGVVMAVGVIGVALMLVGGYYGGEMVYTHGMGVKPMMEKMMNEHEHGSGSHTHEGAGAMDMPGGSAHADSTGAGMEMHEHSGDDH